MNFDTRILSSVAIIAASFFVPSIVRAQSCREMQSATYFKPLTDGNGSRYPLTIGPLSWRLLGPPIQPVKGSDGKIHLAYVLMFTNSWKGAATLKSIEVVDPAHDNAVTGTNLALTQDNEDITGKMRLLSLPTTLNLTNFNNELPSGQSAIGYFDVTYSDPAQVPRAIAHRVVVSASGPGNKVQDFTELSPPMMLSCAEPMVLAPPFKGDGWVNGNGCCREIGPHRFVMNTINGSLAPTETFAIDWVRMDSHGYFFSGDGGDPKKWYGYGAELLAVAPGTVVEVVSDLPDEPGLKAPDNLTIEQIAGNRVIVDLGSNHYAEYDHMVPNSATVHVGDYVRQGDKIGLLGNSGNTTGTHLHFQLMDRPSSLDGSALPFVFDSMQLQGRLTMTLDEVDKATEKHVAVPMDTKNAGTLIRMMPLSLDVLGFR
jgi:hypothetical protein